MKMYDRAGALLMFALAALMSGATLSLLRIPGPQAQVTAWATDIAGTAAFLTGLDALLRWPVLRWAMRRLDARPEGFGG